MADATSAKAALFAEIERQTSNIAAQRLNTINEASVLKDLAIAFRLAAGGAQPGSSVVSS